MNIRRWWCAVVGCRWVLTMKYQSEEYFAGRGPTRFELVGFGCVCARCGEVK